MKWVKDHKLEAGLRAMRISFDVERVRKDTIDRQEGLRRQARMINKLDDDNVVKLALAMAEPEATVNMIVVQKPPHNGPKWVWSGNHRLAGHDLAFPNEEWLECYTVCVSDPILLDVLPVVVNVWEGSGLNRQERIVNAQRFIKMHSMTREEAARLCCVKLEWLHEAERVERVKDMIASFPGVKTNGIAKTTLNKMSPLVGNQNVLKQVAKLLCQYEVKGEEAVAVIDDVRGGKTENQMLGEIGRWEKVFQDRVAAEERARVAKLRAKKDKSAAPVNPLNLSKGVRNSFFKYMTGLSKMLAKHKSFTQLQIVDASDIEVAEKNLAFIAKAIAELKGGSK